MIRNKKKRDLQSSWADLERALVKRCAERSCKLLAGKRNTHIIKCAKLNKPIDFNRNRPMCDYLVCYGKNCSLMCAVEIKSGKFKVSKVRDQLKNGAMHALFLATKIPDFDIRSIFLILVCAHTGKDIDQSRLREPLKVNGLTCTIQSYPCGSKLADIMSNAPCDLDVRH